MKGVREALRAHWPTWLALVAASYAYRLPALLNARSTNSDAAVVGLQAMHMLRGEWSAFLWGSGYQTSADSLVAALWFAVFGASPFVLMLSALTLHVGSTLMVFGMMRRRFDPWVAFLVTMPMVVTPSSVHSYALYPPRQASLTLAMAAFFALDTAAFGRSDPPRERRTLAWVATGGLLATLAVGADPYPLLLLPLVSLYAVVVSLHEANAQQRGARVMAFFGGALVGLAPFWILHRLPGAKSGPMGFTTTMLSHHWKLLVDECLPWALSYKVYFARDVMDYKPWDAPAFGALGILGALCLAGMLAYALVAPASVPVPTRRLSWVGALCFPLAIGAFLVSVMSMDHFSMRYLAVLTLMTPFGVAAAAHTLGPRRFLPLFLPHLLASAIGGWVGYGPFVRGLVPVRETPELKDDYALFDLLKGRGIRYAMADYWASYRLTLLFREELVVVPRNPSEDRYAPYRQALEAQATYAYVFDPGRSREDLQSAELDLFAESARVEKLAAGRLTVFLVTRRAKPGL
ncbi:MAG: hypothetical protein JST00_13255 [Deltaproteobacteria bacterium]|nr:hypothetical protein [Deltaproteobacteria bacterium]